MNIHWYFDVISPFAYLQWPAIRRLAERESISFRPILFAGLLDALGQLGPAEIPHKRRFTYRHVLWRARRAGITLRFPPAHPFNPLAGLRLCIAAGCSAEAIDAVFAHIWRDGAALDDDAAIDQLGARLGIADAANRCRDTAVKAQLQANFDQAMAAGVFGVPTLAIDGELFWGEDATEFALAYLADRQLFDDPEFVRLDRLPSGIQRRR